MDQLILFPLSFLIFHVNCLQNYNREAAQVCSSSMYLLLMAGNYSTGTLKYFFKFFVFPCRTKRAKKPSVYAEIKFNKLYSALFWTL